MTQNCTKHIVKAVPDPYHAEGPATAVALDRVLDLMEDTSKGLSNYLRRNHEEPKRPFNARTCKKV